MIKAYIARSNNKIRGIKVTGHAGYKKSGQDIVCAAVSVLTFGLISSLEEILKLRKDKLKYKVDQDEGIKILLNYDKMNEGEVHDADLLTKSYLNSLERSTERYRNYVKITIREV